MLTFLTRILLISLLALILAQAAVAQPFRLELESPETTRLVEKLGYKTGSYADSAALRRDLNQLIAGIQRKGYLRARLEGIKWSESTATADIRPGQRFRWLSLENSNVPDYILKEAGFEAGSFREQYYDQDILDKLFDRLVRAYSDAGYPFASLNLDSVILSESSILARLYAHPGTLFFIDSVQLVGNAGLSSRFLQSYLHLKSGSRYSEASVNRISERMNELLFLRMTKNPSVTFSGNKASVQIYAEKKNASRFDGILGFVPDNQSGKLRLIGDLKLHLANLFRRAELFDLNYKGLPGNSRELNLGAGFSELFSSPLSLGLAFNLFRQDTSFQNTSSRLSLGYRLNTGRVLMFLQNRSGASILSARQESDSEIGNIDYLSYGTGYRLNTLDHPLHPRKGFLIDVEAEAGSRKSTEDSISKKSNQYRIRSSLAAYYPIARKTILRFSNESGFLLGKGFFENELYRLGGFSNLRGFNEQSILASNYSIFSVECRFLIESSSFLFLFVDRALLKRAVRGSITRDHPLGFGAGIRLQTKAGDFSLSYALGKQRDIPLNLQAGKIHFGLVTLF